MGGWGERGAQQGTPPLSSGDPDLPSSAAPTSAPKLRRAAGAPSVHRSVSPCTLPPGHPAGGRRSTPPTPAQHPQAPPARCSPRSSPAAPGLALHSPGALLPRRAAHETESGRRAPGLVLGAGGRCREITWIPSAAVGWGAGRAVAHRGSPALHAVRPNPGTAPAGDTEAGGPRVEEIRVP